MAYVDKSLPFFSNIVGEIQIADVIATVVDELEKNEERAKKRESEDLTLILRTIREGARLFNKRVVLAIKRHADEIQHATGRKLADNVIGSCKADTKKAVKHWKSKPEAEIRDMANAIRSGEVALREAQLDAALDVTIMKVVKFGYNGFLIGMMQCGKTGALIACLFCDAFLHAIGGLKYKPMIMITEHTGLLVQMEKALGLFTDLFGGLEFTPCGKSRIGKDEIRFDHLVALRTTMIGAEPVARNLTFVDHLARCSDGERDAASFIYRRVGGKVERNRIRAALRAAFLSVRGTDILLDPKMDEGHYGADGKLLKETYDSEEGEAIFDTRFPHRTTVFTATPFVVQQDSSFIRTGMRLTSPNAVYRGINYFDGDMIDPDATIIPPELESLDEITGDIPLAEDIFSMLDDSKAFAIRNDIPEEDADLVFYDGCDALHELVMRELSHRGAVGMCVRATRRNDTATKVADELRAKGVYEVIIFNGDTPPTISKGGRSIPMSVRDLITDPVNGRQSTDMPFLILVTGKARMGDDFPPLVEVHADICSESEYITTVLQGAYGRACGWNKPSTKVILCKANAEMIRAYIAARGKFSDMPPEFQRAPHKATVLEGVRNGVETLYITREHATAHPALEAAMTGARNLTMRTYSRKGRTMAETRTPGAKRQHALFAVMGEEFWEAISDPDLQEQVWGYRFGVVMPGTELIVPIKGVQVTAIQPNIDEEFTVLFRHMTPRMAAQSGETFAGADHRPVCETKVKHHGMPQLTNGINLMLVDDNGDEILPPPPSVTGRKQGASSRKPATVAGRMDVYAISIPVVRISTAVPKASKKAVYPHSPERLAERRAERLSREVKKAVGEMQKAQEALLRLTEGVS